MHFMLLKALSVDSAFVLCICVDLKALDASAVMIVEFLTSIKHLRNIEGLYHSWILEGTI